MRTLFVVLATILVVANVKGSYAAVPKQYSALVNVDQIAVETLALKLLDSVEVRQQKQESMSLFSAEPAAAKPDGRKTLQRTVDEMTYLAALSAANNSDPAHPKLTWTLTAPHVSAGKKIPGSGAGFDNPDNVYRMITVDGASRYEISFRAKRPVPKNYSIYLYDTVMGDGSKRNFDEALAGYREDEIKADADGSFKVTVDGDPANGRVNHMQSPADGRCILFRNMLDDWSTQNPFEVVIKRVAGPGLKESSDKELAQYAARILKGTTNTILGFLRANFAHVAEPNSASKPFSRGGGWGYSARGTFKLADDEALLVTVTTPPDQYLGFQLTDVWTHSVESIHANGSLNNTQAEPNDDGSYTYVISLLDPGIRNWLDTDGLHEGEFLIRWQDLPAATAADAIREVKLVKLADLPVLLPSGMTKVTLQQRKVQLFERARTYVRRYLPD